MRRVHKFEVIDRYPFTILLSEVRRFLKVDLQRGAPVMWYEIQSDSKTERCTFQIFGTGWDIPEGFEYRGTYLSEGQNFVWHLYEFFGDHLAHEAIDQSLVLQENPILNDIPWKATT